MTHGPCGLKNSESDFACGRFKRRRFVDGITLHRPNNTCRTMLKNFTRRPSAMALHILMAPATNFPASRINSISRGDFNSGLFAKRFRNIGPQMLNACTMD
jgi:hypothetical protein